MDTIAAALKRSFAKTWGANLAVLRARATGLEGDVATVQRRLATEKDDDLFAALREEYKWLEAELRAAKQRID